MFAISPRKARAFSLIELVIVVVIIGIIAAIAIPRMSRGAAGANDSTLTGNLAVMRKAIDLYSSEHNGVFPALATFSAQMTTFTDVDGNTSATRTGVFIYGPYLRSVPNLNVGANKGQNGLVAAQGGTTAGWVYDATLGKISPNLDQTAAVNKDAAGVWYANY